MRSYGQLCAMARALDVVGDRWTLLIVRELLIEDGLRFSRLQRGLPGIAANLLSGRLRDLEEHGVLTRSLEAGGPVYRLTPRGRELDGVLRELLRWGAATVPDAPADATFQMHWLSQPARFLLRDGTPQAGPALVRFGDLTDGFDLIVDGAETRVRPCEPAGVPAAVVARPGPVLVALLQGAMSLDQARRAGVSVDGDRGALTRVLPGAPVVPR